MSAVVHSRSLRRRTNNQLVIPEMPTQSSTCHSLAAHSGRPRPTVTTPYGSTFGALYSPQITPAFQDREYVLRLRDVGYMLYAIGASYDHICVATEVIYYRLNVTIAFPGSIPAAPIHLELVPSSPLVAEEIEFVPLISEYKRVSIPVVDLETETFKIRVEPATDPGACSIN